MNRDYIDIRSRIAEPPKWFDERAVPRYTDFSPHETADIYARACCLLLVECQACGAEFHVCMSESPHDVARSKTSLADLVRVNAIHYGDPPNVDCCPVGPSMNSIPRRVLEFWIRLPPPAARLVQHGWQRVGELEGAITCDWAEDKS